MVSPLNTFASLTKKNVDIVQLTSYTSAGATLAHSLGESLWRVEMVQLTDRRGGGLLLFIATLIVAGAVLPLDAQTTFGVIRGTVRDTDRAIMVGVTVTARHEGTNIAREVISDRNGNYELTNLNPGPYTVTAEMEGFQRHVHQGVSLETAQTLRVDIAMQIGQVTESVTIVGEAPLIETDSSTVSDVRTGRQLTELPINLVRGNAFGGGTVLKY